MLDRKIVQGRNDGMTGWVDHAQGTQVPTMLFVLLFLVGEQQINERGNPIYR
jgi:hypothetical protein